MRIIPTQISDVFFIELKVFDDARGYFMETWQRQKFAEIGIDHNFVQDNQSKSHKHIARGLHYQLHRPQGKLVRVVHGAVWDVAVDIRKDSKTFGKWVGAELSEDNKLLMWIPPGCAHGFLSLRDNSILTYKCSDYYAPEDERTILWNDPTLAIDWPIPLGVTPILSDRDKAGVAFKSAELA